MIILYKSFRVEEACSKSHRSCVEEQYGGKKGGGIVTFPVQFS